MGAVLSDSEEALHSGRLGGFLGSFHGLARLAIFPACAGPDRGRPSSLRPSVPFFCMIEWRHYNRIDAEIFMQPEQRQPEQQPDTPVQTDAPEQQPVQPESPEKKSNAKRIIALILTLALLAIGGVAFYNASNGRYLERIPELPSFDPSLPRGKESLEASKAAWPGDGQGYWHAKIGDRPRKLYDAMLPHLAAREDAFEVGYLKDYIDGLESMG